MKHFRMKKNILKATSVAIFSLLGGYNIYNSQQIEKLSDLALTNLEALADDDKSSSVTCISDKGNRCYYLVNIYQKGSIHLVSMINF